MIQLKVDIKDDHQDQFEQLKNHWKFNSNTDTIRFMITYNWEQEINQSSKFVELQEELLDEVKRIINRKDIQQNYYVYSVNDFVKTAVKQFLDEIKNKKGSIFDWDIKNSLTEDELIVSKAIGKIQDSRSSRDFTFDLLMEELDWRNQDKLKEIIKTFEERNFLSLTEINGEIFYQANSP